MANIEFFCKHFSQELNIDIDDISIDIFNHDEKEILKFLSKSHNACRYCDTIKRHNSYTDFAISKENIKEWIV